MSKNGIDILFPVGRFVAGSLTVGKTTDYYGKPLTNKDGTAAIDYSFAVAFAKVPGQDWKQTPWGQQIVAAATQGFPQGQYNNPTFAWKVTDGDSQIPNKKGKKPCENNGWPGHWIVWFSSRFAPKTKNANGTADVPADSIKNGHYVQVFGDVAGNGSTESPGMYVNHTFVAHSGFGEEIYVGPDASAVGFGAAPLPAGASATPVGMTAAPTPAAPAPAPVAAAPVPVAVTPVAPNPAILMPPAPPAPTPPAPPAPAQPTRRWTLASHTYEQMAAAGWADEQLIAAGHLVVA